MSKMIATGPGRRMIAGIRKHIVRHGDNDFVQVKAGLLRIFIEELYVADLLGAKLALELIEARAGTRQ